MSALLQSVPDHVPTAGSGSLTVGTSCPGVPGTPPAGTLSVLDGVNRLHEVLDRIDRTQTGTTNEFAGLVRELTRATARIESLRMAVVAHADKAQVAGFSGACGTGAWLAAQTHTDERVAVADSKLATQLGDGQAPATHQALADGKVSKEHAAVILKAITDLPPDLTQSERDKAERILLRRAEHTSPGKLRREARRVVEEAGRSKREADKHQGELLQSEEEKALARCRFTLHDNNDGTASGAFTVPTLAADILRKTLQQMTAPRRRNKSNAAGSSAGGASALGVAAGSTRGVGALGVAAGSTRGEAGSLGVSGRSSRGGAGAFGVDTDWARRQGLAFADLLEHLPTDRLSGKVAATVVVTVEHDNLRDQIGAAKLDTGHDVSAAEARRIACGAGILPLVLDGQSQILDLGRSSRYFTEAQRTALATRYDECAAEGCDRPYAWTELHHENPWHSSGRTDLELAVPLCGFHHRRMHDPKYITKITTVAGKKSVTYTRRT